jgi:murein DD-endopeptidase MepM/ murein hydrolase activator NlpD
MRFGLVVGCSFAMLLSGCEEPPAPCTGYPDQESSPYVLPWPAGGEFPVLTGNCRTDVPTHSGERRYAYDFRMPVGSVITAARGGTVVVVDDHYSDADHEFGHENVVFVAHADGTLSLYFHLRQSGALVDVGDVVRQGDPVGLVGTSGSIGRDLVPHLHFEVASQTRPTIRSLPITFRNTRPHPTGLIEGQTYRAEGSSEADADAPLEDARGAR